MRAAEHRIHSLRSSKALAGDKERLCASHLSTTLRGLSCSQQAAGGQVVAAAAAAASEGEKVIARELTAAPRTAGRPLLDGGDDGVPAERLDGGAPQFQHM